MTTKKTKADAPSGYDYGECEICDTPLLEKKIKQDFWIRDKLIVIENVPAGVCPKCGEKVVKAEVGRGIITIIQDTHRIAKARRISVPSIRFKTEKVGV